jgi:hypothetical protein
MNSKTTVLLGIGVLAAGLVSAGSVRAHSDDQALAFITGAAVGYVVGSRDAGVRHVHHRPVVRHYHYGPPAHVRYKHHARVASKHKYKHHPKFKAKGKSYKHDRRYDPRRDNRRWRG